MCRLLAVNGQPVFQATNDTMMMFQHVQASPVPPSARIGQPIQVELEDIVMRCLYKDPEKRPANAVELGHRLDSCRLSAPWTAARALDWWQVYRSGTITSTTT